MLGAVQWIFKNMLWLSTQQGKFNARVLTFHKMVIVVDFLVHFGFLEAQLESRVIPTCNINLIKESYLNHFVINFGTLLKDQSQNILFYAFSAGMLDIIESPIMKFPIGTVVAKM